MTWHIIHSEHWAGCTHLLDTRIDAKYAYDDLHGARYVTSDDDAGEVCFQLPDERIVWLVSTDLEFVWPFDDDYLRTDSPSQRDYTWSQIAELNHQRQVDTFGWCSCESDEAPYNDCPIKEESNA